MGEANTNGAETGNQSGEEGENEEVDVKKMQSNFEESQQMMDVIKEFEKVYTQYKDHINNYGMFSLEADVTIKTIKQSYRILKENLYQDTPNFDKVKMEAKIHSLIGEIKTANADFAKLKGEFISVSETLVNKDINILKID